MTIDLETKKDIATHGVSVYTDSIDWAVNSDLNDKIKLEHIAMQVAHIKEALKDLKKKK